MPESYGSDLTAMFKTSFVSQLQKFQRDLYVPEGVDSQSVLVGLVLPVQCEYYQSRHVANRSLETSSRTKMRKGRETQEKGKVSSPGTSRPGKVISQP